ncbi:MAG: DNA topoisomerase [Candidatus Jordarchaeales archaeon]
MGLLVVAEKSSVARAIRLAVRPPAVVALRGHFLELDFPKEYNSWRSVDPKELFRAPVTWVVRDRRAYSEVLRAVKGADGVVIATDNDAEGELIGYEVLLTARKALGRDPAFKRMRFNAATPAELKKAWSSLEPDLKWGWVWKALFRHRFDLVTGAAFTRLMTLSKKVRPDGKLVSWGSCQSPTLWFVYEREMEIRNFKPEKYWVVSAIIDAHGVKVKVLTEPFKGEDEAKRVYAVARVVKQALIKDFKLKDQVAHKPLPTDTDAMLQELARAFGLSGAKAMSIAEDLYADGFISYPRTETNMWVGVNHKQVLSMLSATHLGRFFNAADLNPRSGKRNDGAHPPIHPTGAYSGSDLKGRIWEFLARRYLANTVGKDALFKAWSLSVSLNGVSMSASNKYFVDRGFYKLFPYFEPKDTLYIPQLQAGERLPVLDVELEEKETKPPPRLTEAELLRLLKNNGIGTDATRADYPQIIVERGYAWKKGKAFFLSELGEGVIKVLEGADSRLVTPETRRYVEELMVKVERWELSLEKALEESLNTYKNIYETVERKLTGF